MPVPYLVPAAIAIASEFFPVLATKLGGTRGREVAENVIQVAASVAGTPKDADPRQIIAALKEDEAKAAEVRLRLEELDQEEHQRIVDDRMDARRYQAQVGVRGRLRGTLMLLGVVAGLVAIIIAVFRGPTDPATLALLTTIAGALLKMLSDAFAFEFGSSVGSKEKDAHIENMQKALMSTAQARNARLETEQAEARATTQRPPETPPTPPAPATPAAPAPPEPSRSEPEQRTTVRVSGRDFVAELVQLSA